MEGMNQFGIQYIYTWKYHNETLCIDILKMSFFKNGGQEGKTDPVSGYQWEGEGYKERVQEGEYVGNTMYTCMENGKMDLLKLFEEWRRGR
jgi:hypothetical protein